jgi:predicted DNA-binding transcriptional regulator AlpA
MEFDTALADAIAKAVAAKVVEALRRDDIHVAPEYLNPAQVARLTGYSQKALESLRSRRTGPRFFRVGRSIRYRADDVRAWVEAGAA